MSDPVGRWLVWEIVFIVLGVFCALAANAIRECSESKLIRAAEDGDKKAEKMLPVVREPDDFCAAMRVGAAGFAFVAVMNPLTAGLVRWAEGLVHGSYAVQQVAGGVLWVLLLLLAVAVFDFAPERYAWHRADKAARAVFPLASLLARALRPLA